MGFFKDFFMGTDATPAEHGIDVQYIDDYADYAGIRKGLIDYWQGALQGDVPEWLTKYSDELLRGNMRGINEDYLGLPGDRSNSQLGLAGQVDASRGTGKATTTNRTIQQMMSKKSAAREASAGYRLGSMGQIVSEANKGMLELPQGQRYASSRFTTPGDPGTPGYLKESFSSLMGNLGPKGFDKALSMGSNLISPGSQPGIGELQGPKHSDGGFYGEAR